jgi:hypothetical protein
VVAVVVEVCAVGPSTTDEFWVQDWHTVQVAEHGMVPARLESPKHVGRLYPVRTGWCGGGGGAR